MTRTKDTRIELYENALALYDEAARKFLHKCETGQARSVETRRDLEEALKESTTAQEWHD